MYSLYSLVEEYKVLRDSTMNELSTPLVVTHQCKIKSQEPGILLQFQIRNIGSTSLSDHSNSRLNLRVDNDSQRVFMQQLILTIHLC